MKKYTTSGCKAVKAESMNEAAEIFAGRMARKAYGRGGYCRTCTKTSWAQDGSLGEFSAFIGYNTSIRETTGHNINFTVYAEGSAE